MRPPEQDTPAAADDSQRRATELEPGEELAGAPASVLERNASRIGWIVSAVAVAAVAWWATRQDPPRLPSSRGEIAALAGAIGLYAIATVVRAERWHAMLAGEGATPSRADSYALTTVGYAVNNILPARAGDAVRIVVMAPRAHASKRTVLGTLLAERLLDIAVLGVCFAVVGYGLLGTIGAGRAAAVIGVLALAAIVGALATVALKRRPGARRAIEPVLSSVLRLRTPLGAALLTATLAVWALETGVWMAAGAAVGLNMTVLEGLYLVALASIFSMIPSGPAYAGTQDAAAVIGVKAIGGSGAAAVAYIVMLRFIIVVPITLVGLALAALRYGGLGRIRAAGRQGAG